MGELSFKSVVTLQGLTYYIQLQSKVKTVKTQSAEKRGTDCSAYSNFTPVMPPIWFISHTRQQQIGFSLYDFRQSVGVYTHIKLNYRLLEKLSFICMHFKQF